MERCEKCGMRQRASHNYDDREPDTVNNLKSMIKVAEVGPAPRSVSFLHVSGQSTLEDGTVVLNLDLARYVNIDAIAEPQLRKIFVDLFESVRSE